MMKNRVMAWVMLGLFVSANISWAEAAADQRITIDVDGVPLKEVLKSITEQSGMSYVASEEAQNKPVSLSFDNVPVEEAIQAIAAGNGLASEKRPGSNVTVFTALNGASASQAAATLTPTETFIYQVKYARLSISPIDVGGASTISDLSGLQDASFGGASAGSASSSPSVSFGGSNVVAARGIDRVIAGMLTPNGKVVADAQSNILIITDVKERIDAIKNVLVAIDKPVPQVLIEVYLLEVKKSVLKDHGIEWGGEAGAFGQIAGGSRTMAFPFEERLFDGAGGVKPTTIASASTLTLGTFNANNFKAVLHFLTQDLDTKILARPRILTMSNDAANIKLITNAAIANTTTLSTAEGQATSTSNSAERAQVGITLKMTPQVNDDNTVGLFLEPSVTTVSASQFFPTTFLDPTTRVVRTVARVPNHQTLVIGGLIDSTDDRAGKKIPGLGDVPVVKHAFRYDNNDKQERELLIFITPHIITSESTAYESVSQTAPKEFLDDEIVSSLDRVRESQKLVVAKPIKAPSLKPDVQKQIMQSLDLYEQKRR